MLLTFEGVSANKSFRNIMISNIIETPRVPPFLLWRSIYHTGEAVMADILYLEAKQTGYTGLDPMSLMV